MSVTDILFYLITLHLSLFENRVYLFKFVYIF